MGKRKKVHHDPIGDYIEWSNNRYGLFLLLAPSRGKKRRTPGV